MLYEGKVVAIVGEGSREKESGKEKKEEVLDNCFVC
jgi:hypothetical protein